jgi:HAE1 family hydrophobic/amphiphilic exporter-1
MSPAELFIRRPVTTITLMISMFFFGIMGYVYLPTSELPEVDFPTIQVTASLPGADPETMASSVATPLEKQFSTISGLRAMSSVSSLGGTVITVQFDLNRSIDGAALDVQSSISAAAGDMPSNMPSPPNFKKINPTQWPIFYMAMYSEALPVYTVNDYADTFVSQSLSTIPGVAQVYNYSQQQFTVRVKVNPDVLAARGIGINDVRDAIKTHNVNLPLGTLDGPFQTTTVKASGQLMEAARYKPMIVTEIAGQPVRLEELGEVQDGVYRDKVFSTFDGNPAVILAVQRQPGANTIDIVNNIHQRLPAIRATLPPSVTLQVVYDRSQSIRESILDVEFTLLLALGLVVLVIFLFLRSVAATFVAGIAIPLSVVSTFAVMYMMGFSLDNLSLMALMLSVGFVVDDAIVVIENVFRHMQMGKKPFQAAIDGAKEIVFTIVSITLSLAVVFVPIMFMAGIYGRILNEFAVTITVTILISGAVAICMSPMLSSRLFRPGSKVAESDPIMDAMLRFYRRTLADAVRYRRTTIAVAGLTLAATLYLFATLPKGFLPSVDMNHLIGMFVSNERVSPENMARMVKEVSPPLQANENVKHVLTVSGYPLRNQGFCVLILKERPPRKDSSYQVLQQVTPGTNSIPGLRTFFRVPPMVEISTVRAPSPYLFVMQCPKTEILYRDAKDFEDALRHLPQLVGVNSDLYLKNPESFVEIHRDRASTYGITAGNIEESTYSAYADREVSNIYGTSATYKVILEVEDAHQRNPEDLAHLYVKSSNSEQVRLDAVADIHTRAGPLTVNHYGQLPSATMSFDTAPGVALGQATEAVRDLARKMLPDTVLFKFEGTAQAFEESFRSIVFLLIVAVIIIYLILAILYESFVVPLAIISGLPSAAFGGLLVLWLFGLELNLYGFVGLFMLIGIVKKNAIMVVDFALEAERTHKKSPLEAAIEGSIIRFRPIMMTTIAAIAGMLPIAFGYGAGGESRQPLGLVVVGGLLLSQVVTLYLTPVAYTYLAEFQERLDRRNAKKREMLGIPNA